MMEATAACSIGLSFSSFFSRSRLRSQLGCPAVRCCYEHVRGKEIAHFLGLNVEQILCVRVMSLALQLQGSERTNSCFLLSSSSATILAARPSTASSTVSSSPSACFLCCPVARSYDRWAMTLFTKRMSC